MSRKGDNTSRRRSSDGAAQASLADTERKRRVMPAVRDVTRALLRRESQGTEHRSATTRRPDTTSALADKLMERVSLRTGHPNAEVGQIPRGTDRLGPSTEKPGEKADKAWPPDRPASRGSEKASPHTSNHLYHDRVRDTTVAVLPMFNELMHTEQFKRLWNIKQMGFVTLTEPKAKHTRGEHSRGTLDMADRFLKRLAGSDVSQEGKMSLLSAALLHDIGHYPYSHTLEAVPRLTSHEANGVRIIRTDPEIGAVLKKYGLDPQRVANLIEPPKGGYTSKEDRFLHSILSAPTVDADRTEYLRRDGMLLGVPSDGWFSPRKLISSLDIHPNGMESGLVIMEKGLPHLRKTLDMRQGVREFSYRPEARAGEAMLVKAVHDAMRDGALTQEKLSTLGDRALLHALSQSSMPESTRELSHRLLRAEGWHPDTGSNSDQIYQSVLSVKEQDSLYAQLETLHGDNVSQQALGQRLATALDAPEHHVLFDLPGPLGNGGREIPVVGAHGKLTDWHYSPREQAMEFNQARLFVPSSIADELAQRDVRGALHEALEQS